MCGQRHVQQIEACGSSVGKLSREAPSARRHLILPRHGDNTLLTRGGKHRSDGRTDLCIGVDWSPAVCNSFGAVAASRERRASPNCCGDEYVGLAANGLLMETRQLKICTADRF